MPLEYHPLAEVLPLIDGVEFTELITSIKDHGQHDPIVILDGLILDGRNRYRACLEAGVEPRTEPFTGTDPVAFVADKNLRRRHLTTGEKAMAVVKYATLSWGQHKPKEDTGMPVSCKTMPEIAAMVGINKESLSDAKTICRHGTNEEMESVKNGTAAISSVAKKVRKRRDASAEIGELAVVADTTVAQPRRGSPTSGRPIKIPEGSATLTEATLKCVALQRQGVQLAAASKQIGISEPTYKKLRDIVLLSERDDLGQKDAATVRQALQEVEATRLIGGSWEEIRPIALRVWGKKGTRVASGKRRVTADKRRSRQFEDAISFIAHTCISAEDIEIPPIEISRASAAELRLREAQDALQRLKTRIRKETRT